jgi:hypothetical protein
MDKKLVGLIAGVSGLGTLGVAQASTPAVNVEEVMKAQSFSELLDPVPNAAAVLKAADESRTAVPQSGNALRAQWHHHHHHNWWWRRRFFEHHHHHHHFYHHHHHHHHYY